MTTAIYLWLFEPSVARIRMTLPIVISKKIVSIFLEITIRERHSFEDERRYADRIKALLLWDSVWSF